MSAHALDLKGDAWRQLLNCDDQTTRTPAAAAVLGPQRTSNT